MAKEKAARPMSELLEAFLAADRQANKTRERRDETLVDFRRRLSAGETTGDACRDFVLLQVGVDDVLQHALCTLHERLLLHVGQLALFVQYKAQAQAGYSLQADWQLGILDEGGLLFPRSETGVPSVQIATRCVYKHSGLLFGNQDLFLDALRAGTAEAFKPKDHLPASCHLYVGNAAVVEWFSQVDKTAVPYALWSRCTWVTLAAALIEMGVSPGNIPEMYAWLEEKKADLLNKMEHAAKTWENCLARLCHAQIRDEEPAKPSSHTEEVQAPVSTRVIGGSRFIEPLPTAHDLLKQFRGANRELEKMVDIGADLKLEGNPVFDRAHSLLRRYAF